MRLRAAPTPRFIHLSVEQGLSQSTVQAILQDHAGFLWFGTEEGLDRYDGYTFVVFRHDANNPRSLPDDIVSDLHEDRQGRLWVGTEGGLALFDRHTETFTRVPSIRARVTGIVEDPDGTLWVGTAAAGLFERDPSTGLFIQFQPHAGSPTSLGSYVVSALLRDHKGRLWIGTRDAGLELLREDDRRFVHYRHHSDDAGSLANDEVWGIAEDPGGELWVATYGGGVSVLDPKTGIFRHYRHQAGNPHSLGTDYLTCVYVDRSGTVWVGTEKAGVQQYVATSDSFIALLHDPADPNSVSQNVIRTIYEDVQGQLWVGTYLGGANVLRKSRSDFGYFTHSTTNPSSLSDSAVASFLEDLQGRIWVGTEGGWLNRFDPQTGSFVRYHFPSTLPGGSAVLSLHQDRHGHVWAGSYRGGLGQFNPQTEAFVLYKHRPGNSRSISGDEVWAIAEDREGALWLGTDAGVDRFDTSSGVVTAHYDTPNPVGVGYADVRALLFDRQENLWIGRLSGLNLLNRGNGSLVGYVHDDRDPRSLSNNGVMALHEDRYGKLWAGTLGGGVNRFDPETGTFISYKDFPSNVIYGIQEDSAGRLWFSTNHGLSRFDPATGRVDTFDLTNGLQSLQFHPGASLKTHNGRVLFGSIDGFYDFDPEAIKPDTYAPPVVLTSLRIFNEPVRLPTALPERNEITLLPHDKIFSLEFAALDYTLPRRNRYAYRMEGFSDQWIQLGNKREVTFTNLDPGTYVFRVKASNSDRVWTAASTVALKVIVRPPFWRIWWFRGLSVILFALALFTAYRVRIRRVRAREKELERLVNQSTKELQKARDVLEDRVRERTAELQADIVERKRVEDELRRSEDKFAKAFHSSPASMTISSLETGRMIDVNDSFLKLFGLQFDEVVGHTSAELGLWENAAEREQVVAMLGAGPVRNLELRFRTKAGKTYDALFSGEVVSFGGEECILAVSLDITQQKRLEGQLRQAQKMEAVGKLAGGVAHDFNNLLNVILGSTEMQLYELPGNSPLRVHSENIRKAAEQAAGLTRQLLTFSRQEVAAPKILDLNAVLLETGELLPRLIGEDIEIAVHPSAEPALVRADPIQVQQIIMNLAVNARDAMPKGGSLTMEAALVELDEEFAGQHSPCTAGPHVLLSVSDTGSGISQEIQTHIFEPFFTTKEQGQGTGLGLFTVYGIVQQTGGAISIYSEPGLGTTFKIYLPLVQHATEAPPLPEVPVDSLRGTETILLVEDLETLRRMMSTFLQKQGYTVLEAPLPSEAIEMASQFKQNIHLLLTDVVMPGMDGPSLARHIRELYPRIKTLFVSGYTPDRLSFDGLPQNEFAFLEKPVRMKALARKLREMLTSPGVQVASDS